MVAANSFEAFRQLCECCGLDDLGTVRCLKCQRLACVACSHVAVEMDLDKALLVEKVPEALLVLCMHCSPPGFGPRSRLRSPSTPPEFGADWDLPPDHHHSYSLPLEVCS